MTANPHIYEAPVCKYWPALCATHQTAGDCGEEYHAKAMLRAVFGAYYGKLRRPPIEIYRRGKERDEN